MSLHIVKEGIPEEGETVLCTVNKIYPTSVFVTMDEYEKQGMIHISEISPGRVRNLYDYVREGKKIVCKVLRINQERGHIDLSFRRVTESQRRQKVSEMKQEQRAEKIIEFVAKKLKMDAMKLYEQLAEKVFKEYAGMFPLFEEAVNDPKLLNKFTSDKIAKEIHDLCVQRIKPPVYELKGVLTLTSYAGDGVEQVKEALALAQKASSDAHIAYLGGGRYSVSVSSEDPKEADKALHTASDTAIEYIEKTGEGKFERIEGD